VHFPLHLLIPLVCAFTYVVGALCLKGASMHGAGVWRSAFVAQLGVGAGVHPRVVLAGAA